MTEQLLKKRLKGFRILLASGSPRRQEYLKAMGVSFEQVKNQVEEWYPPHLKGEDIANYLSKLKADAFGQPLKDKDILITADTVVWHRDSSLSKPQDKIEAEQMLLQLSNDWHDVITSVCFTTVNEQKIDSATTRVHFRELNQAEVSYYVDTYEPFDKAGAYGIQEWLGNVAIDEIRGSYPNVVGFPTHIVYKTLMDMAR